MSMAGPFADTPAPPYYAVIFTTHRHQAADEDGYEAMAAQMIALAAGQPGFLGIESCHDGSGFGITVSYWDSEASIAAWKQHAEHRRARQQGREQWYAHYELRVARVERAYALPRRQP